MANIKRVQVVTRQKKLVKRKESSRQVKIHEAEQVSAEKLRANNPTAEMPVLVRNGRNS